MMGQQVELKVDMSRRGLAISGWASKSHQLPAPVEWKVLGENCMPCCYL